MTGCLSCGSRAEIVTSLLAAPDRAARVEVLLAHEQEITADCRTVLGSISHDTLSGQLPLAVKTLDAFEAGHYEAAQALAVTVTETAVTQALGSYAQARQRADFDPSRVTLRQLRVKAALAPIGPFYTAWYPSWGTPAPEALSRHVTIHQAEVRVLRAADVGDGGDLVRSPAHATAGWFSLPKRGESLTEQTRNRASTKIAPEAVWPLQPAGSGWFPRRSG
jgi:hypothetical protein